MENIELYMRRCFELARLGAGSVSPNPMVGAVLVHEGRIIGEGWHRRYGEAHAEVNAVQSVPEAERHLIRQSTLYCSLEPCFHFGKTPPCVDLILDQKIPRVVVSNTDPNPLVAGQSLQKMQAAGIEVTAGVLEAEGRYLNRAFFTWIAEKRPYIVLKWAQSSDGFIARTGERTAISGPLAQRLVHRWRSESDAILVGATTARTDNPRLDNRLYFGKSPLRIALDFKGQLPRTAFLLDDSQPTRIIGPAPADAFFRQTQFWNFPTENWITTLLRQLYDTKHAIMLVEGGAHTLRQFLNSGCWDEIRLIQNPRRLGSGVGAPSVPAAATLREQFAVGVDSVQIFSR